jgi:hypothetical protein
LVVGLLAALAYMGSSKTRDLEEGFRWVARRAVFWLGGLYAFAMVAVGLNRPEFRPAWIDARESQILLVVLIVATGGYVIGAIIKSVVEIQDQYHHNAWESELLWLKEEAEEAANHSQLTSGLFVHWLGTAVVLLRLIVRPYGEGPNEVGSIADRPTGSEAVMKFQIISLDLTQEGRTAFLGRAGPMLSPPGWLTSQYRRISKAFLNQEVVAFGDVEGDDGSRPEQCAYPVELDSAVNGTARGMRWPFAYEVYSGKFDATLRESAEAELAKALLDTFLEVPGSWRVDAPSAPQALGSIFLQLLPRGSVELPMGSLGPMVAAQIGPRGMTPYVWWPASVPLPEGSFSPTARSQPQGVGSSVLFQTVRVDISEPLWLSEIGGGVGPQPEDDDGPSEPGGGLVL